MQMSYSKYHARKTTLDGITFDSAREAGRYEELMFLQHAGEITQLELQPRFLLQDKFKYNGKTERKIEYVADFKYMDVETGKTIVEDVKGVRTEVYKLKRKLFLKKYGDLLTFIEI